MKVLFLCAHPDDLEFSIPSIMISLAEKPAIISESIDRKIKKSIEEGRSYFLKRGNQINTKEFKTKTACMTRGEMSSFTEETGSTMKAAKIRTHELSSSQMILTGKKPDFIGYFDGYVRVTDESINRIKEYLLKLQPDIVITPEPIYTWYHHPDHVRTGRIAYYAIRRIAKDKKDGKIDNSIHVPELFYFQAIWNDWYFPRFSIHSRLINMALKSHKSQAGLLIPAKIPGTIEKIIHGRKVHNHWFGESLRYQPISLDKKPLPRTKKIENLCLFKKFVYYASRRAFDKLFIDNYSDLYKKCYDGRLPPRLSESWD